MERINFFVLGTGEFGGHAMKTTSLIIGYPVKINTGSSPGALDPETAATATYPRLTTESGTNNLIPSDFWMYKTDAFRLAKVQAHVISDLAFQVV